MQERTIGYICVDKNDDAQTCGAKLKTAGCSKVFLDGASKIMRLLRPGFKAALEALRAGDRLMVCAPSNSGPTPTQDLLLYGPSMERGVELESLDAPAKAKTVQDRINSAPDP